MFNISPPRAPTSDLGVRMSNADQVIAALRSSRDHLATYAAELTDEDLAGPSGAAEWDIAQVLSHLGSGSEIGQAGLQAALDGQPGPDQDFNQSVWDRWDAMARREQADAYGSASEALVRLYESLDEDVRGSLLIDLGFLPEPVDVATLGRMRLREFALHSWDARAGRDPRATLDQAAVDAALHGAPDLIAWTSKPEHLDGQDRVVQVSTTEPTSVFTLNLTTPVSIELSTAQSPDGTLDLPAEAWMRLASGRLSPAHTPDDVTTTGAADLDLLRRVFPGY
jgi:uncharacterized protein (TIGR03083 family)